MTRKLLYASITVFSAIMAYILIVSTSLLKYFPLMSAGDLGIHMANISFLRDYGFHGIVTNWYNGFTLFNLYPPLWSYFGMAIYNVTNDYLITTYVALVITYIIGLIGIFLIGKNQGFKISETLLFFLSFFFSYILAVYAIRTGRFPELLSWSIFVLFFYVIIYYKDKKLSPGIIFLPVLYSMLMLTHVYAFVVASVLLVSLLLVKNNKERVIIILLLALAMVLTSFWWVPFLNNSLDVKDGAYTYGVYNELLNPSTIISTNTLVGIIFIILFLIYAGENKRDIKFYIPILVLDVLLLSRLIYFVPFFRNVPTTPYNVFFAFISLFLLFKAQNERIKKVLLAFLLVFSLFSFVYVVNIDLAYEYTELDNEFFSLFPYIQGRYMILDEKPDVHHEKLAAYSALYYNLSTPIGYFREHESLTYLEINNKTVLLKDKLDQTRNNFKNRDCSFANNLKELNVSEIIVRKDYCDFVRACGFNEKNRTSSLCLFKVS